MHDKTRMFEISFKSSVGGIVTAIRAISIGIPIKTLSSIIHYQAAVNLSKLSKDDPNLQKVSLHVK